MLIGEQKALFEVCFEKDTALNEIPTELVHLKPLKRACVEERVACFSRGQRRGCVRDTWRAQTKIGRGKWREKRALTRSQTALHPVTGVRLN